MSKVDQRASAVDEMSEAELLEIVRSVARERQTADSRRQALEELLRRHYDWILRMSLFQLSGASSAFDCAQEVMVEIAKGIERFDGRSELRTWIFVILRRTVWRYRKGETARRGRDAELEPAERYLQSPAEGSPDHQLILSEEKQRLLKLVRELPEMQQLSVLLHYFEDLSVEDTAKRLGCSEGTVKTHLFRARAQLKKLLGE